MHPKMFEEKTTNAPTIIFTGNEMSPPVVPPKSRPYRKYVIIAVTGVVMAAIILAAILVGLYLSTEAQKAILKFSYDPDKNTKQDVTSDPNTNIVQYHVSNPNYETWVVNDFNQDIQVTKIRTDSETNCYVAPLNRTTATDPSKVTVPSDTTKQNNTVVYLNYRAANTPIPDSSFLSKAARDTCKGISTYWVYPSCDAPKNPTDSSRRQKRRTYICFLNHCCGCNTCYYDCYPAGTGQHQLASLE